MNHLIIGITGGIGAGKSLVLRVLSEQFDTCLLRADDIANEMLAPGGPTWQFYRDRLGDDILADDGTLDRAAVARHLYADPDFVQEVNAFVHPRVKAALRERIRQARAPLILLESALMEEGDLISLCDEIWLVTADRETRIARLMKDRGYPRERCEEIMDLQKTDEEYAAFASQVIDNSGSPDDVRRTVCRLAAERLSDALSGDFPVGEGPAPAHTPAPEKPKKGTSSCT